MASSNYYGGGGGGAGGNVYQRDSRSQLFENQNGRLGTPSSGYRSSTPNSRGQYSQAVLDELESQNDAHIEGLSSKVRILKDITTAIGVEVRDSTTMMQTMNDNFDNTRVRLRGTMNRMLRMAERSGVSWKVWLLFIGAVIFLFWYVWLFR